MWNDYTLWNASVKADMLTFVSGSMDALQVSFASAANTDFSG